jgi:hypothetical protein
MKSILTYVGGLLLLIGIAGTILGQIDYVLIIKGVTLPQINIVAGILITLAGAACMYFGWKMGQDEKAAETKAEVKS